MGSGMATRRPHNGEPETASGVALAVGSAGLRVPAPPHPGLSLGRPLPPSPVPQLTGLADPLDVAAAGLYDAVEVPVQGPGGPRCPIHV